MTKTNRNSTVKVKFFLLSWVVLIAFFVGIFLMNLAKYYEVKTALTAIEKEISDVKRKNDELEKSRNYYETDEFVEKIARERLGFVKPGEILFYNDAKK